MVYTRSIKLEFLEASGSLKRDWCLGLTSGESDLQNQYSKMCFIGLLRKENEITWSTEQKPGI